MGINNNNTRDLEDSQVNFVEQIMKYEDGQMEWEDVIDFFQALIDTGFILNLQGHYQRTAQTLIDAGQITFKGNAH